MRIDKIMIVCAIILLVVFNSLPVRADYYGDEKKTTFGFRFGDYSFSDTDNDDFYGDDAAECSLDLTFAGDNPNISWRIALDGLSSSATEYDSGDYLSADLAIGGFSGAVIFHNDRKEKVGFYGGIGLGTYNVTETGDAVIGGIPYTLDGEGTGIGFNIFCGISARVSDNFSIGLEYFIRNLEVDMAYSSGYSEKIDYGGNSILLTLGIGF